MSRLQLNMPPKFWYSTEMDIHVGYVNYAGHLGNDAVLALANEARMRFIGELGYTEANVEGWGMVTADAAVIYTAEAFRGDVLTVEVGCTDFSAKGCDICYRFSRNHDGCEIARAKTGIVFFDHETREPVAVPKAFIEKTAGHLDRGGHS